MILERSKHKTLCKGGGNHDFLIKDIIKSQNMKCLKCKLPFNDCYVDPKKERDTWLAHST